MRSTVMAAFKQDEKNASARKIVKLEDNLRFMIYGCVEWSEL
tara:strand:- start:47 stop:172 length:126 start_codon:yes stop_codon:yes gene_type:complete